MLTRDDIKQATALFLVLDNIGSAQRMVSETWNDKDGTQYGELSVETKLGGQIRLRMPHALINEGLRHLATKANERLTNMGINPLPPAAEGRRD